MKGAALLALGAGWMRMAAADYALNLTQGVTSISREAYSLHMIALWICVGIGIVVFGAIFWTIFRHRKSQGAVPAHFHENTRLEVVWTIIPFIILVVMAVPATKALINMDDTKNADLTIKITGQQWKWQYDYVDDGVRYTSSLKGSSQDAAKRNSGIDPASVENYLLDVDKPLVVPVGKKVRFLLTATDVIHSWWVPALGFKKDAIPGFINEIWARVEQPGTYRGQCTELCGIGHGYMPIVLVAMNDTDYRSWLTGMRDAQAAETAGADREWTKDELMAKGKEVYTSICAACHQATGEGVPGAFKPLKGSALVKGPVAGHLDRVMNGKEGTAMQAFAKQLGDTEIAAVVTYERNSWGNDTGDIVQPAQVKAARK
jgi:cytochrome c oxidase subunit 2